MGLNKSLIPLVKEDAPYTDAAPDLFGSEFAKRSKEFLEQVKTTRSSLPAKSHYSGSNYSGSNSGNKGKSLFRRGQSSGRTWAYKRGGASNQYRGRGDQQTRDIKN